MAKDHFSNIAVPADYKLIRSATIWELKEKAGFFGECARCGLELESAPEAIKWWNLIIGQGAHRHFCLDCGDFLKALDEESK